MNVFFAPDTSDHPNWGCQFMGKWFPRALARVGARVSGRIGSQWCMRRYEGLPDLVTLDDFHRAGEAVRAGTLLPRAAAMLRECDLAFLNGENFIRPGTRKGRRLLFVAYLARMVFEKPCVLANHSVDLAEPELREIVRAIYPQLDEVQFREQASVDQAARYVRDGRWRLVPDVAWSEPVVPVAAWNDAAFRPGYFCDGDFDPRRPYVTVCASSVYSQPAHRSRSVVPVFIELCRRLHREVAPVVLAAPDEPDLRIMNEVRKVLRLPLLDLHMPLRRAMNVIGNAAVHVGGRWHPGIFAATGGTPIVAMGANNHKMHSLVQQLELGGPVFDALSLEPHLDELVALARARVDAGTDLRRGIQDRARALGAEVDQGMEFMRRAVSLSPRPAP